MAMKAPILWSEYMTVYAPPKAAAATTAFMEDFSPPRAFSMPTYAPKYDELSRKYGDAQRTTLFGTCLMNVRLRVSNGLYLTNASYPPETAPNPVKILVQ
ncbi:hypothetical protein BASA81_000534 [Batrachochytrium salamandrivorans]|nr:hypothetical protein BASA81_000534 [Batrachochytrium salamandrivorans]